MKTVYRCYPFSQYFYAIIGSKGAPFGEAVPFGEAETLPSLYYLMYQLTYTVSFGIVASEVILFNHSLVNQDTYIYVSLFYALKGGSISAPVIKERKEKNPTPVYTSTSTTTFLFAIAKRRRSNPGILSLRDVK